MDMFKRIPGPVCNKKPSDGGRRSASIIACSGWRSGWLLGSLAALSFILPPGRKTTVWMIGDSTMCLYDSTRFPLTGWGMPFAEYFDSTVVIKNEAKGGRSTRTFIAENRWQQVVEQLSQGDYVIIQFGHNDEAKNYPDRYTPPDQYRSNLLKFVMDSRQKGALPVLVTPVSRRKFDREGNALETHAVYAGIVREVALQYRVPLVDLDQASLGLLRQYGPEYSKLLFNQLEPGTEPAYPSGVYDNTHFNTYGARHIAELVLSALDSLHLGIADHIARSKSKNL